MPGWLTQLDQQLFNLINQKLRCSFLDTWMPLITEIDNWIWLLALAWLALFIFGGRRGKWTCVVSIVTILIIDNLNSYILKPFFGRLRPGTVLTAVQATTGAGIPYSFPSNHAANMFALAMVLTWYYPKIAPIWFLGAIAVGYSRVYIGVHYPLDVLAGAVVGILGALCIIWCAKKIDKQLLKKKKSK